MANQPPPLPWSVRTAPERVILLVAMGSVVVGGLYVLVSVVTGHGWSCAWKSGTGWPCASCGGTRSLILLAGGEWREAVRLNPGIVAAVVGMGGAALYAALVLLWRFEPWRPRVVVWRWALVAAFLGNWVYVVWAGRL